MPATESPNTENPNSDRTPVWVVDYDTRERTAAWMDDEGVVHSNEHD